MFECVRNPATIVNFFSEFWMARSFRNCLLFVTVFVSSYVVLCYRRTLGEFSTFSLFRLRMNERKSTLFRIQTRWGKSCQNQSVIFFVCSLPAAVPIYVHSLAFRLAAFYFKYSPTIVFCNKVLASGLWSFNLGISKHKVDFPLSIYAFRAFPAITWPFLPPCVWYGTWRTFLNANNSFCRRRLVPCLWWCGTHHCADWQWFFSSSPHALMVIDAQ